MNIKSILIAVLLMLCGTALAAPVRDKHVSAELIPEVTSIAPGDSFTVAVKLVHDEHWHTYWINDGDSGLPTTLKWDLPEGFTAGGIQWPFPMRIPMAPLVSYGYEDTAWLLTEITAPDSLPSGNVTLTVQVKWLMCKEACIPGKVELSVTLPVTDATILDQEQITGFKMARQQIPSVKSIWTFEARASESLITLFAVPPDGAAALVKWDVFAVNKGTVASSLSSKWEKTANGYVMTLDRELNDDPLPSSLQLVMVSSPTMSQDPDYPAVEVNVPLSRMDSPVEASNANGGSDKNDAGGNLLLISLSAFLGGMILNLMPCVFPVISLKILGFVNQAQDDPKSVWRHGLVFAAGVVVSFWILAGILIALRAGGESIGWGFQLQSPVVLVILSLVFFILSLNLFGLFEMGLSLTVAGGSLASSHGLSGSFFSGFLATVVATPCTAPFMGAALGYALTQPPYVSMVVFTALAVGMAFPYLILSRFPTLLSRLPKPGAWMETMKQSMGFLLLATVLWLMWVLASMVVTNSLITLLAAFLLAGVASWVMGKWTALNRKKSTRVISRILSLFLFAGSFYVGIQGITKGAGSAAVSKESGWETFSPERLEELQFEGKAVFVDFTAKWCLTCQANKLTALRTKDVMQAFKDKDVTLLYADWTDENEIIAKELAKYGRQSVPLYLLFPAGQPNDPVVLPEILTKKIVLDALKNI